MHRLTFLAAFATTLMGCAVCSDTPLDTAGPDVHGTARIVSVEFFGGLCATGPCSSTLDFSAPGQVTLDWATADGGAITDHTATAVLTTDGLDALDAAELEIGDTTFDASYGCPGCDDGGAVALSLWGATTRDLQQTQWEAGAPPAEASVLEALAYQLAAEVKDCSGGDSDSSAPYTTTCEQSAQVRD